MSFIQMSISGAVLITVIIILRTLFLIKLPKKSIVILWRVALIRLLIPFNLKSNYSIYSLLNSHTDNPSNQALTINSGFSDEKTLNLDMILFVVWIIGAILLLTFFITMHIRYHWYVRTSLPIDNEYVEQWCKKHTSLQQIKIRESDRISSPLTYGTFHPVILLPKNCDFHNSEQMNYVLFHELTHIRHFDSATKILMSFTLCLHWFNPMVWVMYFVFNRDIELVCDESVILKLGNNHKRLYAMALINMEERKSMVAPFGNYFSKIAIEERIEAIMKTKKISVFICVLVAILMVSTVVVFATSANTAEDNSAVKETTETTSAENETNSEATESDVEIKAEFDGKEYRIVPESEETASWEVITEYGDELVTEISTENNCVSVNISESDTEVPADIEYE